MSTAQANRIVRQYGDDQRKQAVYLYLVMGNIQKVSTTIDIPVRTLHDWKNTAWWNDLLTEYRVEKKEQLNSDLTRLIDISVDSIEKAYKHQEVKPKEAATILGICFDKRQILNHQPTNITSTTKISDLAKQFDEYLNSKTIEAERVIDNQGD